MIDSLVTLIFSLIDYILSNDIHIIKRLGNKYGRGIVKEVRKLESIIPFTESKGFMRFKWD